MKKILSILIIGFMVVTAVPVLAYAEDVVYQENVIDKISDWAQTVGKTKEERDRILAQNKAERQKKHMQKMAEKKKKQAAKKKEEIKKKAAASKKDAKKKFGL